LASAVVVDVLRSPMGRGKPGGALAPLLTGIIPATQKVLDKAMLTIKDIDYVEVNEASSLLSTLESSQGRFGLQTMCEAGGMANAMVVERF
jgi:acetyl-CoA acyltransferase